MNNPLMYNDPSGEFIFTALVAWLGSKLLVAAVIGAAVGLASYTIGLAVTGNLHQWKLGGALKATFFGALGGAVSYGIGSIFTNTAGTFTTFASNLKKVVGGVGLAIVKAGMHGISQGVLGLMKGDSIVSAAAGGFFGSLGAELWGGAMKGLGYDKFAKSTVGIVAFGALSGGIGAELSGGNFWQGVVTGGIVAALNHVMHRIDPPKKKITFTQAKDKYQSGKGGGKVEVDASTIDWSNADLSEKGNKEGTYRIKLLGEHFSDLDDALVHGIVTVVPVEGKTNYYQVAYDKDLGCRCGMYDFEQHSWESWYSKRNILTAMGKFVNGITVESTPTGGGIYYKGGKPFIIEYKGIFKIGK